MKKGMTYWFTGLSGAGKTTYAIKLRDYLLEKNKTVYLLDGDEIRNGLCKGLGFSKEDRLENIRRIRYLSKLLNDFNIDVIVAAITPYQEMRNLNRKYIDNYTEIYVYAPLKECICRDIKGLYKKALNGEIKNFTGIDDPFDEPKNIDIYIDTYNNTPMECYYHLISNIKN